MREHFVDSASVHEHSREWFPRVLSLAPVWTHNGKRRHQSFAANARSEYSRQCEIGLTEAWLFIADLFIANHTVQNVAHTWVQMCGPWNTICTNVNPLLICHT